MNTSLQVPDLGPDASGLTRRLLLRGLLVGAATLVAGLLLVPVLLDSYQIGIATDGALLGIFALSVGFLAHRLNLISLGHTAFYGGSAYTAAIMVTHADWSLTAAFAAAVTTGTVLSVVFGALVVRSPGMSFLMLTLALGQLLYVLSTQAAFRDVTGSFDGLAVEFRDDARFLGIEQGGLIDSATFWPLAWTALTFVGVVLWLTGRSRLGILLEAIRENEERARFSGYNTYLPRLAAFTLTGFCASLGGALFALHSQFVSPDSLAFLTAGDAAIAAIIGGYAVLAGPVVGAAIFTAATYQFSGSGGNLQLYTGLTLVLVLAFLPGGITSGVRRLATLRPSKKRKEGSR